MQPVLQFLLTALVFVLAISLVGAGVLYFLWYYERQANHAQPLPGAAEGSLNPLVMPAAFVLEAASFAFLVITYPLRLLHDVVPFRAGEKGETPIILVHGWGANSACFLVLQVWLKLQGHKNVYAVSCTPPVIRAEKLSKQLAVHIDKALAATDTRKVHIIAHSMGGLLTRYAIKNLGMDTKIDKVITLGSPHMGSKLAGIVPGGGNTPQMRYQSEFTRELAEGGLTPGKDVHYYSIYSEFDNFVLPNHSSVLDGNAQNIHVAHHGHCALLYSPVVFRMVGECLGQTPAPAMNEP